MRLPLAPAILDDLLHVDQIVDERMRARSAALGALGAQTSSNADTRLLAALTLLAAQLGTYRFERVQHVASTVELIRAAVYVHDDLVDQAARRTGSSTLHEPWDKGLSLMLGDYLFALAALEMAEVHNPHVISYFSQAVMRISEGMLAPVLVVAPFEQAQAQYLEHIGAATAALFEAACKAGLTVADGTPEQIEAIGRFGYDVGLAFQIVDDVADYAARTDAEDTPSGDDLRRGRITLPLIAAVAATDDTVLATVVDHHDEAQTAWALARVQALGIAPALATAQSLRDRAVAQLDAFPDTPARAALIDVAAALVA